MHDGCVKREGAKRFDKGDSMKPKVVTSPSRYVAQQHLNMAPKDRTIVMSRMNAWVDSTGARAYRGQRCLTKLLRPQHRCRRSTCYIPPGSIFKTLDHLEFWKLDDGRFIATAHPYDLFNLPQLTDWSKTHSVELRVGEQLASWYYASAITWLIQLTGNPRTHEPTG